MFKQIITQDFPHRQLTPEALSCYDQLYRNFLDSPQTSLIRYLVPSTYILSVPPSTISRWEYVVNEISERYEIDLMKAQSLFIQVYKLMIIHLLK